MRVYVPLTPAGLATAYRARELGPAPLVAYAVTPDLLEWCGTDDLEELEYEALGRAALASLRLLAGRGQGGRTECRRVVVAVEVGDDAVSERPEDTLDPEGLGEVRLTRVVPLSKVAAVQMDDAESAEEISAASAALEAADQGGAEARALVETAAERELLWFARQEIEHLL